MRELKEQHFEREKHWKLQLEQLRGEKRQTEALAEELQTDLASVRAQNSLFSEWMLVRNENALMAQRGDGHQRDRLSEKQQRDAAASRHHQEQLDGYRHARDRHHEDSYNNLDRSTSKVAPLPPATFADDCDSSSLNNDADVSEAERVRERYSATTRLYVQTSHVKSPSGARSPSVRRNEVSCHLLSDRLLLMCLPSLACVFVCGRHGVSMRAAVAAAMLTTSPTLYLCDASAMRRQCPRRHRSRPARPQPHRWAHDRATTSDSARS